MDCCVRCLRPVGGLLPSSIAVQAAPARLTANNCHDEYPVVGGQSMARAAQVDGADCEIMFSDGTSVIQLANNGYDDFDPRISGNGIVWRGFPKSSWEGEIFLFDGTSVLRLTDNDQQDRLPEIHQDLFV